MVFKEDDVVFIIFTLSNRIEFRSHGAIVRDGQHLFI